MATHNPTLSFRHCDTVEKTVRVSQMFFWLGCMFAIVLAITATVAKIRHDAAARFANYKTAAVFAEGLAMTDSAMLVLDRTGVILKSNQVADGMFGGGQNIEGRNVHDFCRQKDTGVRGAAALSRWYGESSPDAAVIILASAVMNGVEEDLLICAKAIPPTPGNKAAILATVNYAKKVMVFDVRDKKEGVL